MGASLPPVPDVTAPAVDVVTPLPVIDLLPRERALGLTTPNTDAAALADNPGYPVVYLTLRRKGKPEEFKSFTFMPEKFEYVSSVMAADKLEFTVPDPELQLIEEPWLAEDLNTEVQFRFGYRNSANMSEMATLVFFRQAPSFEAQNIETTLVAYDKGIFLTLPTKPRLLKKRKGEQRGHNNQTPRDTTSSPAPKQTDVLFTFNELLQLLVEDVNKTFDEDLQLDTGGKEYKGQFFRMTKAGGNALEYLIWLANFAEEHGEGDKMQVEVFVKDNTVFFRPAQKRVAPIAEYRYFSAIPGERLLSFRPEVNLTVSRKTVAEIDDRKGVPAAAAASNTEGDTKNRARVTDFVRANGVSGKGTGDVIPGVKSGDKPRDAATYEYRPAVYTVTWRPPMTLQTIAAKYDTTVEKIIADNPSVGPQGDKLTPGMTLTIKAFVVDDDKDEPVSEENRRRAALSYVYEEDQTVRASATVIGDPHLRAGWPIVIRNVGKRWEGLWYLQEVKHQVDSNGYTCDLSLTRDGFAIGEEMEPTTGNKVLETPAERAKVQERKKQEAQVEADGLTGARTGTPVTPRRP